ncbi:MAG: hypothetical protein NTX65_11140 [Ignavibacteriales bacterium]|nr:hypothetical protein [Ignavibacteriales bacterium]
MRRYFTSSIVLGLCLFVSKSVLAQTQSSLPINFSASFFGNYSYTVQGIDGRDFNKFDIERMYFTAKSQVSENWKFQMTTDVYRNSTSGTYYSGLAVRMKFAFVDFSPLSSLSIKAGMIPGPWNGAVEVFWKYRGVAQTANDKYGYIQTADLGLSVTYLLPDKYGELAGYVFNGETYSAPESSKYKDIVLRVSLVPLPNSEEFKTLTLGGYTYLGKNGAAGLKKQRFGGLLGYSYDVVLVGAEYDSRTDGAVNAADVSGNVFSLFTEIKLPVGDLQPKLSLLFRYDSCDLDTNKDNDKINFLIAGLAWKPNDKIEIVLNRQIMTTDARTMKSTAGTFLDKDEKWLVNTIVTF